ncbi:MAG: prolipoprotein diacylglyceryl transferase [Desulfobacteraceae bacterium]|nr:MAG: prolipoprotein diacylglyceryl transferase [Desulfobacteraceae bacterium]
MIIQYTFLLSIVTLLFLLFRWAFRELPAEKWQIIGVIPSERQPDGSRQGINLTFYGFFIATASLLSTILVYILLGSLSIPAGITTAIFIAVLSAALPSANILARIIEKKAHTKTVGGASFVGIILAPWVILLVNAISGIWTGLSHPILPMLTAFVIAYAFGEGIGRLACISFGCCYGRPMNDLPKFFRNIIGLHPLVFHGETKKIVYAGHLEGVEVFPIQAVTAVLYCSAGVVGIYLFLNAHYTTGFLLTLSITQGWRFLSEFLRADFRGNLKISVYQIMALLTIPYGFLLTKLFPFAVISNADLLRGFTTLWNPWLILFLQTIWIVMFLVDGRSHTTGSILKFHVNHHKI